MNVLIELQNDHLNYSSLISGLEMDFRHLQNAGNDNILQIIMSLYPLKLDMEIHFAREEYALFPSVAHPIIPLLIEEHIKLREKLKEADNLITAGNNGELDKKNQLDRLKNLIDSFHFLRDIHISKEETLLFPYLADNISKREWESIEKKFMEFNNIIAVDML